MKMAARSWSQMAGNETVVSFAQPEPVAGSSKDSAEKTISLNDIMSEQLAVELQGMDHIETQLAAMEGLGALGDPKDIEEYRRKFLREAGLVDFDVQEDAQRSVFFSPLSYLILLDRS